MASGETPRPTVAGGSRASTPESVVAIDIGATKTLVAIAPLPIDSWPGGRVVVAGFATPRDPASFIGELDRALEAAAGNRTTQVVAVGCGAPGPLDPARGVIVHSPNLGWRDLDVVGAIRRQFDVPIAFEDDANLGALGEAMLGAGKDAVSVAYLTLSTGIGAGLVLGGETHRGAHSVAMEVGHLVVDPAGPPCGCGHWGCVEAYAGGLNLGRRAREAWAAAGLPTSEAPRDAASLLKAAQEGDDVARTVVDAAAAALGFALAVIAGLADPEVIVVGGSLAMAHPHLVERAAAIARERCIPEAGAAMRVLPASLGAECVVAGAAVRASRLVRTK